MMQTPDIGRMILERTGDAHEIEVPFGEVPNAWALVKRPPSAANA